MTQAGIGAREQWHRKYLPDREGVKSLSKEVHACIKWGL